MSDYPYVRSYVEYATKTEAEACLDGFYASGVDPEIIEICATYLTADGVWVVKFVSHSDDEANSEPRRDDDPDENDPEHPDYDTEAEE